MNIFDFTKDMDVIPFRRDICYFKLPVKRNTVTFNDEGIKKFNELYQYCLDQEKKGFYRRIKWTTSKDGTDTHYNIRTGRECFIPPMWDLIEFRSGKEIVVIDEICFRFQIRPKLEGNIWAGHVCYRKFKRICKEKFDFDLDSLAIDNGEEIAASIEYPPLELIEERVTDKEIFNAHHIDFNSAYLSGMAVSFPELEKPIEYCYSLRKKYPHYKEILTHITGYFRSPKIGYKFAHLSKSGIEWTRRRVYEVAEELRKNGYIPIAYNVDGIWYIEGNNISEKIEGKYCIGDTDKGPYHGPDEGNGLFQWKNDHINCRLRYRSMGAYEFIDNGKYYPVLRGSTAFEKLKPRSSWGWGDIYHATLKNIYFFDNTSGFESHTMDQEDWEGYLKKRRMFFEGMREEE